MRKYISYGILAAALACAAPAAALADDWHHGGHGWHHDRDDWHRHYHYAHGGYYGYPRAPVIVAGNYYYPPAPVPYYGAPVPVYPAPAPGAYFRF